MSAPRSGAVIVRWDFGMFRRLEAKRFGWERAGGWRLKAGAAWGVLDRLLKKRSITSSGQAGIRCYEYIQDTEECIQISIY